MHCHLASAANAAVDLTKSLIAKAKLSSIVYFKIAKTETFHYGCLTSKLTIVCQLTPYLKLATKLSSCLVRSYVLLDLFSWSFD